MIFTLWFVYLCLNTYIYSCFFSCRLQQICTRSWQPKVIGWSVEGLLKSKGKVKWPPISSMMGQPAVSRNLCFQGRGRPRSLILTPYRVPRTIRKLPTWSAVTQVQGGSVVPKPRTWDAWKGRVCMVLCSVSVLPCPGDWLTFTMKANCSSFHLGT